MRPRPATLALLALLALALPAAGSAAQPLHTAVVDPGVYGNASVSANAFARTRGSGATFVRLALFWSDVAPTDPGAAGADPEAPAYRWEAFDRQVRQAAANGLTPIVSIGVAPLWAQGPGTGLPGTLRPDAAALGRFARAAARRYGGEFGGLPRVRYWQVWNEPNLHTFLSPQFVGTRPASPAIYRGLVNAVAGAVKGVRADNIVIAGGTAPFRDLGVKHTNWGPLGFMRELLCLDRSLKPKCSARIRFDVWSHHPYTSGGPTHKAVLPDDVSLGDLPEMRRVLVAARRAGVISAPRAPLFWVTEFSWDSSPPDPEGVPTRLHTRWVAEAVYRMWRSGVSLVTWFSLRDEPLRTSHYQSGLYYRGASFARDRPKPARQAFRFPVVAIPDDRGVLVWGRTPASRPGRVVVERSVGSGWRRLALLETDRYGIFQRRFAIPKTGHVRARLATTGEKSIPFGVRPVPDRFFNPFGQTRDLEPKRP